MEEEADLGTCNRWRSLLLRMSPARIRLLSVLASGTEAPIEAAQKLGVSPVTVYHHLTVLKTLGLIQVRRVGRSTLYSLNPHIDATDVLQLSGWFSRRYEGSWACFRADKDMAPGLTEGSPGADQS